MKILTCLSPRERFSPKMMGAIGLCVYDFTRLSRYKEESIIAGTDPQGHLLDVPYTYVPTPKKWWRHRYQTFIKNGAHLFQQAHLIEVHNQPLLALNLASHHTVTLHLHNTPKTFLNTLYPPHIKKKITQKCAGVLCVSNFIAQQWCKGLPEHLCAKVHVLYNGLHIPHQKDLLPKEKYILFVGRILLF